ncbi:MAG: YkoF family thiamine/hydroxymethylpyrimidine-binding protein [Halioglobus sp.]
MKLTAELSLYPFTEEYIGVIRTFIENVAEHEGIEVVTNAMSTQICGDYEQVFALIKDELKTSFERFGKQVLVCKLIPGELVLNQ